MANPSSPAAPRALFCGLFRGLCAVALLLGLCVPLRAEGPKTPRPAVCEEATNATNDSNATAEATLALWERCLAEPTLRPGDRAMALCNKGAGLIRLKRQEQALEPLDQCLEFAPRYARGLASRFMVHYRLGNAREAVRDISAAISQEPKNLEYRQMRAHLACELNVCERGLDDLDVLVRLSPDKAEALQGRAWALSHSGQLNRALLDLDAALELAPGNGSLHADRGQVLCTLGRGKEGLAELETAVRLLPGDADMLGGRGAARESVGLWQAALEDHQAALKLAPESAVKLNNLAWLYATCPQETLRNPAEALRLAEASVAKARKANNLDTLAAALARNGRYARAAEVQEEVLALLKKQGSGGREWLREASARLALYRSEQAYAQPMAGRAAQP